MTITIHWSETWKNVGGLTTSPKSGQDAAGSSLRKVPKGSPGKKRVNTITVAPSVEETQP